MSRTFVAATSCPQLPHPAGAEDRHAEGWTPESGLDGALAQLPPGGKLFLGEGHGAVEVAHDPDGGFELTFDAGAWFGAGARATVLLERRREVLEALSDPASRQHHLLSGVRSVEGELSLEAAVELGLVLGPTHTGDAAPRGAATQKLEVDLTTGAFSLARRFELEGAPGAGLGVTFRRRGQLSLADRAALKRGKLSLRGAAERLHGIDGIDELELHQEGHLGHQPYQGRRVLSSQGPLPDPAALRGRFDSGARDWSWEARSRQPLGARAAVEVLLLQTRGSFTDFYATLSHRVGQRTGDASFLAFRRALAR